MAWWTEHSLLTTFKYNLLTTCWNHVIKYKMEVSMCPKCLLAISKQTKICICMHCIHTNMYTNIKSSLKITSNEDFSYGKLFIFYIFIFIGNAYILFEMFKWVDNLFIRWFDFTQIICFGRCLEDDRLVCHFATTYIRT